MYYIGNLEFAKLVPGEAHFYDLNGDEIEKQTTEIKWDAEAAEKGGFEHFMMKEIHEQPKAVQDTLNSVIKNGVIDLSSVEITEDEIKNFEQIYIVACGSAWHVGTAAQYVLEDIADIPVRVELASEFRYRKMPLNQKALVIVISQSGETAFVFSVSIEMLQLLLVIDDFGMERGTEYALEQIYNIIDSRYRSRKPLIVTTNLTLTELKNPQDTAHARIYDRLLELCTPIACTGPSMRKDIGQAKLNLLKTLLA